MDIMEGLATASIMDVEDLSEEQRVKLQQNISAEMMKTMELYGEDQITDQKFLLTIQKLHRILGQEGDEAGNLTKASERLLLQVRRIDRLDFEQEWQASVPRGRRACLALLPARQSQRDTSPAWAPGRHARRRCLFLEFRRTRLSLGVRLAVRFSS